MSVHQFEVEKINGQKVSLQDYENKVLLIVNTASKCKFTPQFDDLQKIYSDFQEQGLEILGFPCNQFGEQEPGTSEEATSFCQINYGVKFPIFAKIEVNGDDAHPLFQYLKKQAPFKGFDDSNIQDKLLKMMIADRNPERLVGDEIKWNFTKFLVDANGNVLRRYEPTVEMEQVSRDIEQLLNYTAV